MNTTPAYNLNVVLRETGIKADTLRAWERRYGLPIPARTEGGHRLYSERDIATIHWLNARLDEGIRIKQAVNLWKEMESSGQDPLYSRPIGQTSNQSAAPTRLESPALDDLSKAWVNACLNFDEFAAEHVASQAFAFYPVETVLFDLLLNGLATIGDYWYANRASVQQEHFSSSLVVRQLNALIAAAAPPARSSSIIVGCPSGEDHTIAPLTLTFMLRQRGWKVVYLGANVPQGRFEETILSVKPAMVVMIAQHLISAAALLDMAESLAKKDIQVGFGGLIFKRNPQLQKAIQGHFLGDQLKNAALKIEEILIAKPPATPHFKAQSPSKEILSHFREMRPMIEQNVSKQLKLDDFPFEFIAIANQFFAQNIESALLFGNLKLVDPELVWIEGLITNHNIKPIILKKYLQIYHQAAQQYLIPSGQSIVDWLNQIDAGFTNK